MDKNLLQVGDPIYQTLSDFIIHPFGVPFTDEGQKLDGKYEKFKSLISVAGYSILDESYYIHIKVPSESQPGKKYDVVIQFIPQTKTMEKESFLTNYVIQFFSNSPSFIYKYAALYKLHGYMIDALQEKLDPEYADKLPEKSNTNMKLMYDKSLYFACKFLYDNRLTLLSKSALRYTRKISFKELINSIDDNKTSLSQDAYAIEQKAVKEGRVDREKVEKTVGRLFDKRNLGNTILQKKTASKSTSGSGRSTIRSKKKPITGKKKITPTTSTKRS